MKVWTHRGLGLFGKHYDNCLSIDEYAGDPQVENGVCLIDAEKHNCDNVLRLVDDVVNAGHKVFFVTYKGWKYSREIAERDLVNYVVHDESLVTEDAAKYVPLAFTYCGYGEQPKKYDVFCGGRKMRDWKVIANAMSMMPDVSALFLSDKINRHATIPNNVRVIRSRVGISQYKKFLCQSRICAVPLVKTTLEAHGQSDCVHGHHAGCIVIATRDATCDSISHFGPACDTAEGWANAIRSALRMDIGNVYYPKHQHTPEFYINRIKELYATI